MATSSTWISISVAVVGLQQPTRARCPFEETNIQWENIVAGTFPVVERNFAGAVSALTHGMSLWSDLHHTSSWSLTTDAITGKSEMKNPNYMTSRAAPEKGFSSVDWATPRERALNSVGVVRSRLPSQRCFCRWFDTLRKSCTFPRHARYNETNDCGNPVLLVQGRSKNIRVAQLSPCA